MDGPSKSERPKTTKAGYCIPPEHTRFQKGQSGNPKGRPKGTLNMATVLERTLREKVVINENGRRKMVTKLEAAFKQLVNLAATGELRAIQLLSALARSIEEQPNQQSGQQTELGDADQKVLDSILKRFGKNGNGEEEK